MNSLDTREVTLLYLYARERARVQKEVEQLFERLLNVEKLFMGGIEDSRASDYLLEVAEEAITSLLHRRWQGWCWCGEDHYW